MARKFVTSIDLAQNELQNARVQNLASAPGSPVKGQIYFNTTSNTYQFYDGTSWQTVGTGAGTGNVTKGANAASSGILQVSGGADKSIADWSGGAGILKSGAGGNVSLAVAKTDYAPATTGSGSLKGDGLGGFAAATLNDNGAPTAPFSMASQRLTTLADPTSAQDAATKNYVDLALQGIAWKASVRAATTAAGTLASSFANTSVIDGVTLATGDRILIKNQAAASENGIYTVNATGAPTRATDADTGAEMAQAAVFIREGTTNAESAWVCSNDGTITLGTTGLTFVQFSTAGGVQTATTTTAGITRYATPTEAAAKSIATAAVTPAGLAPFTQKYSATIGDGTSTSIAVTHNLGSQDVHVQVRDASTNAVVECDITMTSANVVTLGFVTAPAANSYRVVVIG